VDKCVQKKSDFFKTISFSDNAAANIIDSVKILLHTDIGYPKMTPTPQKMVIFITQGKFITEYVHINIIHVP